MPKTRIYMISGGVGGSGEQIARTALAQFRDVDVPVVVGPLVRRFEDLRPIFGEVAATGGMIIHNLVNANLREQLTSAARKIGVTSRPIEESANEVVALVSRRAG